MGQTTASLKAQLLMGALLQPAFCGQTWKSGLLDNLDTKEEGRNF